jgi:hypothetical protein
MKWLSTMRTFDGKTNCADFLYHLKADIALYQMPLPWIIRNFDRLLQKDALAWYNAEWHSISTRLESDDAKEIWEDLESSLSQFFDWDSQRDYYKKLPRLFISPSMITLAPTSLRNPSFYDMLIQISPRRTKSSTCSRDYLLTSVTFLLLLLSFLLKTSSLNFQILPKSIATFKSLNLKHLPLLQFRALTPLQLDRYSLAFHSRLILFVTWLPNINNNNSHLLISRPLSIDPI